jgi:hypothetical protein
VYATTLDHRAWRLPSGGTTWLPLAGSLPEGFANAIAGDPLTAGHALADTAATFFAPFAGQGPMWRTTPAGATWSRAATGLNGVDATDVAPAPTVPRLVLAATRFDAVQRSTDGGATWSTAATGLPDGEAEAVTFDGRRAGAAYVGNAAGRACRAIPGAHGLTHRVVPADGGHRLRLVVTARNVLGAVVASSAATARARTGPGVAARPRLRGRARVGARLGARVTVVGFPAVQVHRQWQRCGVRRRGCVASPAPPAPATSPCAPTAGIGCASC